MNDVNEIIESVNEAERMRGAYIDSQEYARDCRFLINKLSEKEAEMSTLIAWHNREMKRMQHELNQAIEVLKFYGELRNHLQPKPFYMPLVESDRGEKARQILIEIGVNIDATQTSD